MANPLPPKTVAPSFSSNKGKKKLYYLGFSASIVLVILVFFFRHRQVVEDPIAVRKERAEQEANAAVDSGPKPVGMTPGNEPVQTQVGQGQGEEEFLKQMQELKKEQIAQQEDLKRAQEARTQQEIQQARDEAVKRGQPLPPGVSQGGVAQSSSGEGGQNQVPEKLPAPSLAGYDTTSWVVTQGGRVLPGYQTGAMYPSDPLMHGEYEQAWFNSFATPIVMMDENSPGVIKGGHQGNLGTSSRRILVHGEVTPVRAPRAGQGGDAAHWGGWVTVRPVQQPQPDNGRN